MTTRAFFLAQWHHAFMTRFEHDVRGLMAKILLLQSVELGQMLVDLGRASIGHAVAREEHDVALARHAHARIDQILASARLDRYGEEMP